MLSSLNVFMSFIFEFKWVKKFVYNDLKLVDMFLLSCTEKTKSKSKNRHSRVVVPIRLPSGIDTTILGLGYYIILVCFNLQGLVLGPRTTSIAFEPFLNDYKLILKSPKHLKFNLYALINIYKVRNFTNLRDFLFRLYFNSTSH